MFHENVDKKKNELKIIQTAGYNGARTVLQNFFNLLLEDYIFFVYSKKM